MVIFFRATTIAIQVVATIVSKVITTVAVTVQVAIVINLISFTILVATVINLTLGFIARSKQPTATAIVTFSAIATFTATALHIIAFSTVATIAVTTATATVVMVLTVTVPVAVPALTTTKLIKAIATAIQLFLEPHLATPFTIPTATMATHPLTAATCFYQVSFFSTWVLEVVVVVATPEYQRSQPARQAWSLEGEQ